MLPLLGMLDIISQKKGICGIPSIEIEEEEEEMEKRQGRGGKVLENQNCCQQEVGKFLYTFSCLK